MSTDTRELIGKIAAGNYSDDDLAEFLGRLKTMDKASFMEAYQGLYQEINKYPPEELGPGFKDRLEQRLDALEVDKNFLPGNLVAAGSLVTAAKGKVMPLDRKRWYAAAAILICLVSGAYFLFVNKPLSGIAKEQTREPGIKNDIPPGGNKATLTLANGSVIVLDSAQNGALAMQGQVNIVKTASGRLAYTSLPEKQTTEKQTTEKPTTEKPADVLFNTIATPRGGQYQVVLADGTKVWLNSTSSIKYPIAFSGNERRVEITGEAYFEVAKNPAMPFKVKVNNDMELEVLGTHFNIMAYSDENIVNTTLLEGSVKMSMVNRRQSTTLKPGQQLIAGKDGQMNLVPDADLQKAVSWKDGKFIFRADDIRTIMRQFSRWYNIDVRFDREKIPGDHYTFSISRQATISQVLKMLEAAGGVAFQVRDKEVWVIPKPM